MAVSSITTDVLRSCIKVEGGSPEKLEERKRSMPLKIITCLVFSFKSLRSIDWLQGLHSITKLYLDNNDITKMENLSHLKTLRLLDLSFNKIQNIEGLEGLTSLVDISLYSNQIEKISGLENLQSLTSLSLGKNRIKRLQDIVPLRRLVNLHVLTLEGNPLSADTEYKPYVYAHMRDLTYFDHCFVWKEEVSAAREQYQDEMTDLKQKEGGEEIITKAADDHAVQQALYAEANLLGCDTLFHKMVTEDPEYPRLKKVPDLLTAMDEYKEKYEAATEEIIGIIVPEYMKKQEEFRIWQTTMGILLDKRDEECRSLAKSFQKFKKKIYAEVREDPNTADEKLEHLRNENDRMQEMFLELEMLTFAEVHDIWSAFDNNYTSIVDANKLQFQNYFGTIRLLENSCSDTITAQASYLMEQLSLGEIEVQDPEGFALLRDKDMIVNAIQASHDARTLKLDSLEDQRLKGEQGMQQAMNKKFKLAETKRNRERIEEIDFIHQLTIDEINDLISSIEI